MRILVVALVGVMCASGVLADGSGPAISRQEFFAGLDYSTPALGKVKAAVDAGDYDKASGALLDYMRARRTVKYFVNSWEMPAAEVSNPDTRDADSVVAHSIPSSTLLGNLPPYRFESKIDWGANPYNDHEYAWTLNRHVYWVRLADAYWATHDEKYAREFVSEMMDWVRSCPVVTDGKHNSSPSWRTIETGIRMGQSWPVVYQKFLNSPSFTPEANLLFLMSMVDQARHLIKNPTTGNWLTMEMNGLVHVGVLLPEFKESAHWRQYAMDRLTKELHTQVYPDGTQFELTTGYHRVALGNFLRPYDLCKLDDYPVSEDYARGIEKLYEAIMFLEKPCGYLPALNDSDVHIERPGDIAATSSLCNELCSASERFGRKDMLYAATLGSEGTRPAGPSHAFDYGGLYVMRQDWTPDSLYLVFDSGPFGAGHQHEDKLSFEAYAYGATLLFDCGRDSYPGGEYRSYAVSTLAHNTCLVDGNGQARRRQPAAERKWIVKEPSKNPWVSHTDFDYAEGVYDDGYGAERDKSVKHHRAILYVKDQYWLVLDRFEGTGKHTIDTLFHFAPGEVQTLNTNLACASANPDKPNILIYPAQVRGTSLDIIRGRTSPCQGWISTGYGQHVAAPVADYTYSGELPAEFAYLLYPSRPSEQPIASIERVALSIDGHDAQAAASAFRVTLKDGGTDDILLAYGVAGEKRFAGITTDARIAVVHRAVDGSVTGSGAQSSTYLKSSK